MLYNPTLNNYVLEAAAGNISGITTENKFGRAPSGIQTTATDIWGRADATPTQQIWLAPTAARIHAIVSSSVNDTSAGTGARTIRIYYIPTWSTAEASEDVTLNGMTPVNMIASAVMINRMKVLTWGSTSSGNAGTISATAAADSTVSVIILPGRNQTTLGIYGLPSTKTAFLTQFKCSINDATAATRALFYLVVNENPDVQTTNFLIKTETNVANNGTSGRTVEFNPYLKIAGPAIIKLQAIANVPDVDGCGGFDLFLRTN